MKKNKVKVSTENLPIGHRDILKDIDITMSFRNTGNTNSPNLY
jgi:hypothetical protein